MAPPSFPFLSLDHRHSLPALPAVSHVRRVVDPLGAHGPRLGNGARVQQGIVSSAVRAMCKMPHEVQPGFPPPPLCVPGGRSVAAVRGR